VWINFKNNIYNQQTLEIEVSKINKILLNTTLIYSALLFLLWTVIQAYPIERVRFAAIVWRRGIQIVPILRTINILYAVIETIFFISVFVYSTLFITYVLVQRFAIKKESEYTRALLKEQRAEQRQRFEKLQNENKAEREKRLNHFLSLSREQQIEQMLKSYLYDITMD
jgi:hypothetical protein